ncbi:MAG TPA: hypothetical protein PKO06_24935, partial [Candidatus Ozemobacteraceae bacterium]|nr:hypothetical protein [Candidatus Ozemobacteraceae bacterium]
TGCITCRKSGYISRTAIHEIMTINDEIHSLVINNASARIIRTAAVHSGMRTMREDGLRKMLRGVTTYDEVIRLTRRDDVEARETASSRQAPAA